MKARIENCEACNAEIMFLMQANAEGEYVSTKANPIEVKPHEKGNIVVNREKGVYRMATPNEKEIAKEHNKNLYISHFATCPKSKEFKKS